MRARHLAPISLATLIATAVWLIFLIAGTASVGPIETAQQALDYAGRAGAVFYLTYANAALITLLATMLFAGLYSFLRAAAPIGARVAIIFVPAYAAMNLFVYLSQISILPRLLAAQTDYGPTAHLLAAQMIQAWPGSLVAFINGLAYAILGIPSIIFGVALTRIGDGMRTAGLLLLFSGVASILGLLGLMFANPLLQLGSLAGGALFLLALFPLTLELYRERWQ